MSPAEGDEADPLIGTCFGHFRVTRRLGGGGMGAVYLAEHPVIGSRVAVKVLRAELVGDGTLVDRFYREARAVNLIHHPNIVSVLDVASEPAGRPYLLMEYLEGRPLSSLVGQPMDPSTAIPILTQVCDGLDAAHRHGVVHRDLKPANIFLIPRGRSENFVKLLDFGMAKLLTSENAGFNSPAGMLIGTPSYMAPEQANGDPVDGRTDLYALGVLAYQLATGVLPFQHQRLTQMLLAHRSQPVKAPHLVHRGVPEAWSQVILRAMAKDPAERFQTGAGFKAALEAVRALLPKRQASDPSDAPPLAADDEEDGPARDVLRHHHRGLRGHHYAVLEAPADSDFPQLRRLSQLSREKLKALRATHLSRPQREELEEALDGIDEAEQTLGSPARRADYDAARNNFRGVAQCIAAGLTVAELEVARKRYVSAHPSAPANARIHFDAARSWEERREPGKAAQEYEKALAIDPLNLDIHKYYRAHQHTFWWLPGEAANDTCGLPPELSRTVITAR